MLAKLNGYSHRPVKIALSMYHILSPGKHLEHAAMTLCRHTDILEDGTLRDNGNRNYEFVVRTIATVGNYGESGRQLCIPALILLQVLYRHIKILLHHC